MSDPQPNPPSLPYPDSFSGFNQLVADCDAALIQAVRTQQLLLGDDPAWMRFVAHWLNDRLAQFPTWWGPSLSYIYTVDRFRSLRHKILEP